MMKPTQCSHKWNDDDVDDDCRLLDDDDDSDENDDWWSTYVATPVRRWWWWGRTYLLLLMMTPVRWWWLHTMYSDYAQNWLCQTSLIHCLKIYNHIKVESYKIQSGIYIDVCACYRPAKQNKKSDKNINTALYCIVKHELGTDTQSGYMTWVPVDNLDLSTSIQSGCVSLVPIHNLEVRYGYWYTNGNMSWVPEHNLAALCETQTHAWPLDAEVVNHNDLGDILEPVLSNKCMRILIMNIS